MLKALWQDGTSANLFKTHTFLLIKNNAWNFHFSFTMLVSTLGGERNSYPTIENCFGCQKLRRCAHEIPMYQNFAKKPIL